MQFDMNNAIEIDRNRNVEMTSLMKDYATFSNEVSYSIYNAEFLDFNDTAKSLMTHDEYFNFCVPLSMWLGFCEDYKRGRRINFDTSAQ